jgi:hypothetical protein
VFQKTLDEVKPEFVLALGSELWKNAFVRYEQAQGVEVSGKSMPFCVMPHCAGSAFIFGINHPASFGWTYRTWSLRVQAALSKARELAGGESSR